MAPPFIDPRANLKATEESDEEMGDAPAGEDPVTDWVNNLNKFKTLGKDFLTMKAPDLEKNNPMERLALCSWRAHVYDVASAFDAIITPRRSRARCASSGRSTPRSLCPTSTRCT